MRQRNRAWPTGAIQRGAWLSAEEAATKRVVELLAASVREVLTKIDGGAVATPGGERTLTVADAPVHKLNPDWRTQLLGSLANPNVVYILMLIGVYGLIFELVHPGAILPGIVGAVCLGLAVYAFQDLAINYTGLGLILLSLLLFLGEVIAPSFGGLGLGGWVTFVLGSTSLIEADGTGPGLAWPVIGTGSLATGTFVLIVSTLALRSFRRRPVSGVDTLIGRTAITLEPLHPEGRVRINGESWRACAEEAVPQGATVIVVRIEGLTLHVARTAERHQ